ncbi:hypothetical protein LCGC14_0336880 [marine sediment metagenome]|uniref:Uncharacterized protein n=1 Tax=marine sediment metagenome TaxID=412755 RepID=A0A0F9WMK3_9ZZZZ
MNANERGEELADFVEGHIDEYAENHAERLIMARRVVDKLVSLGLYTPPPKQAVAKLVEPMSDVQVRLFRMSRIPVGKYFGQLVGDVSLGYFCRLTDPSESRDEIDRFMHDVRRYLASEQIQREIEAES